MSLRILLNTAFQVAPPSPAANAPSKTCCPNHSSAHVPCQVSLLTCLSFKIIYLFIREAIRERQEEREREKILPSSSSLPRCPEGLNLVSVNLNPGVGTSTQVSRMLGRNPVIEASLLPFRVCVSQKMSQGQELGAASRAPVWSAGVVTTEPDAHPSSLHLSIFVFDLTQPKGRQRGSLVSGTFAERHSGLGISWAAPTNQWLICTSPAEHQRKVSACCAVPPPPAPHLAHSNSRDSCRLVPLGGGHTVGEDYCLSCLEEHV